MRHGYKLLIAGLGVFVLAVALILIAPGVQEPVAANGTIHYVDADATSGGNNGSSWADAYTELQLALDAGVSGDQIWVAEGTYTPTAEHGGSGDRYKSFQMKNGVAIYGGFDPTEGDVAWEDRDWEGNVTILSGDIGTPDDNSDNCYHVLYHPDGTDLASSAILDGFTITGGNANGDGDPRYYGGGMYNHTSSPALTNCTFTGNRADYGGAMYNHTSSPALTNCIFSDNSANHYGGGMSNRVDASPTLINCTFEGNLAVESGGGGMYNEGSSPVLTNCTFSGNSADWAGGMFNYSGSSPTLTDCTFVGNLAVGSGGGGMDNYEFSSPTLTNCTFKGNSASSWGGGMSNRGSSPTLINCAFSGNSAGSDGGGMSNRGSSPTLTNCTFWGNSADHWGGGIFNLFESSPTLVNCILWSDTPEEIFNYDEVPSPVVTYSDIQGGYEGEGNIDLPPFFVDPVNGDYHLRACSPCIDAGDNDAPYLPDYDFEGDDRIVDGDGNGTATVDMGVDEVVDGLPCLQVYLPVVLRNY